MDARRPPRSGIACLFLAVAAGGCAQTRQFSVTTMPRDAVILLNGEERGRGMFTATLPFSTPAQAYTLVATRPGFEDATVPLTLATPPGNLRVDLKPKVRPVTISVEPAEAMVLIDGRNVSNGPVSSLRYDLQYKLDESLRPVRHTIRVERAGFAPAETTLAFDEERTQYVLKLKPLRKDLLITTTPPGAQLTLDGVDIGTSPATLKNEPFGYDAQRERFITRKVVATKPGYPPTPVDIAWDDGKIDYAMTLGVFNKRVRIETDPPDAEVRIDGQPLRPEDDGSRAVSLEFPPLNESGKLKEYALEATVNREGEIWKPATATIGWDEGRPLYQIKLEEILTRTVDARAVEYRTRDGRWSPVLVESKTSSWKDVTDGPLGTAVRITDLPPGSSVASFSISPNGKLIAYALVEPDGQGKPKSRLYMCRSDGLGGSTSLTDGRQLDLTPTFDPGGNTILFSSDRGGGPQQIWSIPVDGQTGATRMTAGNADHLWPQLDTSPKPRVFYQSLVPGQDVPRLYSAQVGTVFETDLVTTGGFQPRLSPRNDALAFVQFNSDTRKTDIMRTGDRGGLAQKITDTPDVSERDPAWSPDGTKLAITAEVPFASGQGTQTDVYVVDASGGNLRAITMNDALDDLPAWSPTGDAIYFRSNRGGKWDIWKLEAK